MSDQPEDERRKTGAHEYDVDHACPPEQGGRERIAELDGKDGAQQQHGRWQDGGRVEEPIPSGP